VYVCAVCCVLQIIEPILPMVLRWCSFSELPLLCSARLQQLQTENITCEQFVWGLKTYLFTRVYSLEAPLQERNHGWKVEGDQGLSPNTGALALTKGRAGCWCGRGSPPPAVRVRVYHPRPIFENSDAKSCILVDYLLWNFLLFGNYSQEVGGPIHWWSPNQKSWGTSLRGPYGCCASVNICL